MIYTIADLHLSIDKDKSMEIFPGWQNYQNRIEQNWSKKVKNDDTVIVSGDISWGMTLPEALPDFAFINKLPGKKIMLKGNHDYWWSTVSKINGFIKENELDSLCILHNNAYEVEDKIICGTRGWLCGSEKDEDAKILSRETQRLELSLKEGMKLKEKLDKEIIVFLHYPPVYGSFVSESLFAVMKSFGIKKCFYGHIHGNRAVKSKIKSSFDGIKLCLISADFIDFDPVLVS